MQKSVPRGRPRDEREKSLWVRIWQMKELYVLGIVPFVLMFVFSYIPMYGVQIAFRDFKMNRGIWGSEWIGLENIVKFFNDIFFARIMINTLRISLLRMTLVFVAPIVFALLMNELANIRFKRVVQTISYLPHFLSWVVIATLVTQVLSPEYGVVNSVIEKMGGTPHYFLGNPALFVPILLTSMVWAGVGWGSIVYLAAIAQVDQEMYESAVLDGANRFQKVWHITLPSIIPTITILFILNLGGVLSAGFDPVYNLQNNLNLSASQTIDTYVFEQGIAGAKYSYTAAIGLFQNVMGLCLLMGSNFIIKKINDQGIF